jgi:hypothetical protein
MCFFSDKVTAMSEASLQMSVGGKNSKDDNCMLSPDRNLD